MSAKAGAVIPNRPTIRHTVVNYPPPAARGNGIHHVCWSANFDYHDAVSRSSELASRSWLRNRAVLTAILRQGITMATTAAIGMLIGALLGLQPVNVLIVAATVVFAAVAAAAVEIIQTQPTWGAIVTGLVVAASIQSGYLAAVVLRAAARAAVLQDRFETIPAIHERMEVVGSDGRHVGFIDHRENPDRIILSKEDPIAGGRSHLIWIDWVDYVDHKVHLNRPFRQATAEWSIA
jgi:hypothetical protein